MKQAFTLIELLVAVLIIGILAAIALPQYQVAVCRAHVTELQILSRAVWNAQERYKLANGVYAEKFIDLDVSMPAGWSVRGNGTVVYSNTYQLELFGIGGVSPYIAGYLEQCSLRFYTYLGQKHGAMTFCLAWDKSTVAERVCASMGGTAGGDWTQAGTRQLKLFSF